jgi:hypothetical protein
MLRGAAKDLLIRLSAIVSGRLSQDFYSAEPIGDAFQLALFWPTGNASNIKRTSGRKMGPE